MYYPDCEGARTFSHICISHLNLFFCKMIFFPIYSQGCLFYCGWVSEALCKSWILALIDFCCVQRFFSYSVGCFFTLLFKSFLVWYSPFVCWLDLPACVFQCLIWEVFSNSCVLESTSYVFPLIVWLHLCADLVPDLFRADLCIKWQVRRSYF